MDDVRKWNIYEKLKNNHFASWQVTIFRNICTSSRCLVKILIKYAIWVYLFYDLFMGVFLAVAGAVVVVAVVIIRQMEQALTVRE